MKLGILGTGMMVRDFLQTVDLTTFSYVGILGRKESEPKVQGLCREFGLDAYFLDYDEMLSQDMDTMYIALPNHLHASYAKKALLHGKHVIVEKPAAATLAELQDLRQTAKEQKRMLIEAMSIPFLPAYHNLKKDLEKLGPMRIVSLNYSQYSSRYDAFLRGETLPVFDPKQAGGALMDLNVYNIHTAVGLFGKPQSVHYEANVQRGIDTSGILLLDYGTFKVAAIGAKDCKAPLSSTFQGEKGCIRIQKPLSRMTGYELISNDGETAVYQLEDAKDRLCYEFQTMQDMIRNQDWELEEELFTRSLWASEILEEARRQIGIL
ncbi:MAG: Gfo/Idh/MocA family oxidoreductase [Lachnospiraceae bacterium]|nr:Gfo/Idh/MocA family oxidoreductase [Lachnospiraceae bacterium]